MRWIWILGLVCGVGWAERISVPFRDPSRPGLVKASALNGSITVQTHAGKEVLVEVGAAKGWAVEEEGNSVRISPVGQGKNSDLQIWVPERTSLNLRSVNGRGIFVENVEGDLDVESVNGSVNLNNVSGTVVAHALNGKLTVRLKQVSRDKPMSFSTLNGTVDVTLPPDVAANFQVRNVWGEIRSDFAIGTAVETKQPRPGKMLTGRVNGGGPEISFRSMNGSIYIRKAGVR
jgi:DUF4097 and DUF4098 domain-containing protein YvlB